MYALKIYVKHRMPPYMKFRISLSERELEILIQEFSSVVYMVITSMFSSSTGIAGSLSSRCEIYKQQIFSLHYIYTFNDFLVSLKISLTYS